MNNPTFPDLLNAHERFLDRANLRSHMGAGGPLQRYRRPVLTRDHVPVAWRYDLNPATNPFRLERLPVNAVFNSGAIFLDGEFILVARIEGVDRKSFFGIARSKTGIDNFRFDVRPLRIPDSEHPATNMYDMRLTLHEDGWIYGVFCVERPAPDANPGDTSSAEAQCGIIRTRDLINWERLPDFRSPSKQQRNVVLHPEFVDGQYAWYTRPQDGFIEAGSGGGIGWALSPQIDPAICGPEQIMEPRVYHTIKESKNGPGAPPIKTDRGWLHIAHGVRSCAAGLRYVLYAFVTSLSDPSKVIAAPGGHLLAPLGRERVGDVSNVLFCNGAAVKGEDVYVYYASSDTRLHVATSTIPLLLDYCFGTPPDAFKSAACVDQRIRLIDANLAFAETGGLSAAGQS